MIMRQMSTKASNALDVEFRFDDVPAISVTSQLHRRILSHLGNTILLYTSSGNKANLFLERLRV